MLIRASKQQMEATLKRLICIIATITLASCSSLRDDISDVGSNFLSMSEGPRNMVDVTQLAPMRVAGVTIEVPETLRVSEENNYRPEADIVWRGDPFGDRYAQVKTIFDESIARGVSELAGERSVNIHIILTRFHAVTERTRYSIGGVHDIDFLLSVTDQQTGQIIVPTYLVNSQFPAFGGDKAIAAERMGLTQKIRISEHLARLIRQELTGDPAAPLSDEVPEIGGNGPDPVPPLADT